MSTPAVKDHQTLDRFSKLIQQLKTKKENSILINDADGDGLSSAKILRESLLKIGVKIKFIFAAYDRTNVFGDFLMKFIEKNKIKNIFITDLNPYATNFNQKIDQFQDKTIIVFDHHEKPQQEHPNVIYFHPSTSYEFKKPSQYCSSKLVYDIMSNFTEMGEWDWVASIGLVSDVNYYTWKEFVDGTLKKLGLPIPSSPFDSELQKVGLFLYYALAMDKESTDKAVKTFLAAKNYQEALENLNGYEAVGEEINFYLKKWKDYAEEYKEVIFIIIKPKYKINSLLSSRISNDFPHKTIAVGSVIKNNQEVISFSLRRQDGKVDLPKIICEVSKTFPKFIGGGHRPAAGAQCRLADYEECKKLFVKLHEKYKEE